MLYKLNDRYTIIGKSGSGKTTFTLVLATKLLPWKPFEPGQTQIWWIDTKGSDEDLASLARAGFCNPHNRTSNRILFKVRGDAEQRYEQANAIFKLAYKRTNVLIVIDEYKQVIKSDRKAGEWLEQLHMQGRGLNIGLIGETQEPAYIPRQLISQASFIYLFRLFFLIDIETAKKYYSGYDVDDMGVHSFYWTAVDESKSNWKYCKDYLDLLNLMI